MPGPLAGVKVVEIAQEIQGPYAGLFLADMGADVIKIEMRDIVIRNFRGVKIEQVLDEVFPSKTTDEWMALLNSVDILATPVQEYRDILNNEQALANGYISEMEHPQIGKVRVVGNPITLSDTPLTTTTPPPELGQHSEEILLEAGFSWEDIATFQEKEVV